ncbi:MAG: hypothetical protein KF894_00490 [Labilithrix sp.]|nr:hypothetical protein [Labilithrix sp.]
MRASEVRIVALFVFAWLSCAACERKGDAGPTSTVPLALDTSCAVDDDCVPAPSCCPIPCTSHVINRKDAARANDELKKTCTPEQCAGVRAGGCRTHAYLCVQKTCKLVYADDPDYRAR